MLASDDTSKYMLLYSIILTIYGDNQKKTDEGIIEICKVEEINAEITQYKTRASDESIFTRLRSEIAHTRENTSYYKTIQEIHDNISYLHRIVKRAILNFK